MNGVYNIITDIDLKIIDVTNGLILMQLINNLQYNKNCDVEDQLIL